MCAQPHTRTAWRHSSIQRKHTLLNHLVVCCRGTQTQTQTHLPPTSSPPSANLPSPWCNAARPLLCCLSLPPSLTLLLLILLVAPVCICWISSVSPALMHARARVHAPSHTRSLHMHHRGDSSATAASARITWPPVLLPWGGRTVSLLLFSLSRDSRRLWICKKKTKGLKQDVAPLCGPCGTNAGPNAATAAWMRGCWVCAWSHAGMWVRLITYYRSFSCRPWTAPSQGAGSLCVRSWGDAESHGVVGARVREWKTG